MGPTFTALFAVVAVLLSLLGRRLGGSASHRGCARRRSCTSSDAPGVGGVPFGDSPAHHGSAHHDGGCAGWSLSDGGSSWGGADGGSSSSSC